MKLEQSFTVAAPLAQVWSALVDIERVAPCLPGAEITGHDGEGAYSGNFTVKLGPTTAAYSGVLEMQSVDESTRTATMTARGTDKRGQGGATATIVSTARDVGGETAVDVVTDFTITGRLARFGRSGMIEDISNRLLRDFAECLQSTVGTAEPAGAEPPADVVDRGPRTAAAPPSVPAGDCRPRRRGRGAVRARRRRAGRGGGRRGAVRARRRRAGRGGGRRGAVGRPRPRSAPWACRRPPRRVASRPGRRAVTPRLARTAAPRPHRRRTRPRRRPRRHRADRAATSAPQAAAARAASAHGTAPAARRPRPPRGGGARPSRPSRPPRPSVRRGRTST